MKLSISRFDVQNMPRPFKQLRELDIVKVADDMAADLNISSRNTGSETA